MSKKDREKAINAIGAGRAAVGASAWLVPNLSGRLFGLDPESNPQASYLGRLFGARDVVLGLGAIKAPRKQKNTWLVAGLACDVADTAAGAIAGARGTLPLPAAVMVTATAAGFAAAGYALMK